MSSPLGRILRGAGAARSGDALSVDQWMNYFSFNGLSYPFGQGSGNYSLDQKADEVDNSFQGYAHGLYRSNGIVFACIGARHRLFTEARFQFRAIKNGRPGDLFGTPALLPLEKPWLNGTTGDLLGRALQDVDVCGNFFALRPGRLAQPSTGRIVSPGDERLARLRPDWVTVIAGSDNKDPGAAEVLGYAYTHGGVKSGNTPIFYGPEQVAHWTPTPDPMANWLGMSWLTPVLTEIMADGAAMTHKLKFFEHGAAQPLDAGIVTPNGWVTMGDVRVGMDVTGPDGQPRKVLGVYPQGEKDIYRVTMSDGSSTECCEDHLWQVATPYDRALDRHRVMKLREIIADGVAYDSGPAKWSIPLTDPVRYESDETLPMDPYLLGSLLGDGSFRSNGKGSGGVSFSTVITDADETAARFASVLPDGVSITRRDKGGCAQFYFKGPGGAAKNPLTQIVRDLDLYDVIGYEKAVPERYMRAGVADRVAMLQGLIDTDGHIELAPYVGISFTNTSEVLARQVAELAQGLGGVAVVAAAGERLNSPKRRPQWRVRISRLPAGIVPVRLSRKVADYVAPTNRSPRHRYIQSVELVRRADAQCIKVDAADGLYVTDGYIVTHNTPNLMVTLDPQIKKEQFDMWVSKFKQGNEGIWNAYKTMFLGGGADAKVIGANMQQMDFKTVQGHGETRVASAAGVPPIIVGLSEGLEAATYSLPYDGSVWTCDGPRAIGDIRPGDHVWTQVDGKILRRRVTWQGKTGDNYVYTVKTKNRTFKATGNHPVLMPDGSWRNVEDLTTDNRLIAPLGLPDLDGDSLPNGEPATADVLQWLGAYTGDGCLAGDRGVTMCLPPEDRAREHYIDMPARMFTKAHSGQYVIPGRRATDGLTPRMVELRAEGLTFRQIRDEMGLSMHPMSVRDRVRTATREYVGERSPVVVAESRNGFRFHSTEAVAWHREMGVTGSAKTKRVPSWVFGLREDLRLAYLAGVVDTDGSVGKDGRLVIHFANRELVEDVRMLLVSCGIQCSNIADYFYTADSLPNPGNQLEYRAWRFTASSARDVARIPFADPLYRERVEASLHRHRPNVQGSYKIVSIERGRVIQPVYDIEVEGGGHTFLADGVVVHNSNYGQARRAFADGTMRPLWRGFCAAMGSVIDAPQDKGASELWYDARDIAFLQEDQADAAKIQNTKAITIHTLVTAGFTPDSVIAAVEADDYSALEHTGMYSVQLLPAGTVGEGKGSVVTGSDVPTSDTSSSKPAASGKSSKSDAGRVARALLASKN